MPVKTDWLVKADNCKAKLIKDENTLILTNELISRHFVIKPNCATTALYNQVTGEHMIRGFKPEAKITLDGTVYDIGGLAGQLEYAYLTEKDIAEATADDNAFKFTGYTEKPATAHIAWKRKRHSDKNLKRTPEGIEVIFSYKHEAKPGILINVHYALYDNAPVYSKWVTIKSEAAVRINSLTTEILAVVEHQGNIGDLQENLNFKYDYPQKITIDTDYAFGGSMAQIDSLQPIFYEPDPQYSTQVEYRSQFPLLVSSRLPVGPEYALEPDEIFESHRTHILLHDTTEQERRTLAIRRMYRLIAPWVTENPIFSHVVSANPETIKTAIDQCAEVGFEMVIISFGSRLNEAERAAGVNLGGQSTFSMEITDEAYLAALKDLADYAHSKGIELGGYSLLASRSIDKENDVVNDAPRFGNSPCLCSGWGEAYFDKLYNFFEKTGFDVLEHDGSYPGDTCASTEHPHHEGEADSQWRQWRKITDFYKWCCAKGIYLNVPDWYYLTGSTKNGMGYKEVNWSLPRDRQIILARQNIFDGTREKTPSMGWMFVPLTQYHGGGEAATIEPLCEHLPHYEAHLANLFLNGVQAAYRGHRLYDTDETKELVKRMVALYKKYRDILESDIIHVARPDGRQIDGMLHVNPNLEIKGFLSLYNPLSVEAERVINVPMYYTGLKDRATFAENGESATQYDIIDGNVELRVKIPAKYYKFYTIF